MDEVPLDVWLRRRMALRRSAGSYYSGTRAFGSVTGHSPMRPSWICTGCGGHWPCRARRTQLLAEFHCTPVSLGLLMARYFINAAQDLKGESAHILHQRFIGWLTEQSGSTDDQRP